MKNFLLLCAFLLIGTSLLAQDSSYFRNMIGANISYQSQTNEFAGSESQSSTFSFAPVYAHFLSPKVALGVRLGFGFADLGGSQNIQESTIFVEPFARIHEPIGEKLRLFWQPSIGTYQYFREGERRDTDDFRAGVDLGLVYFFKKRFSAELVFSGINYRYTAEGDSRRGQLSVLTDMVSPDAGLRYYFGK